VSRKTKTHSPLPITHTYPLILPYSPRIIKWAMVNWGQGEGERGRQGEINLKLKSQNSKLDIKLGVRSE